MEVREEGEREPLWEADRGEDEEREREREKKMRSIRSDMKVFIKTYGELISMGSSGS